jgi:hypothetical protein
MNENQTAPVSNLRTARKEQAQARAASKAAHPAGSKAKPAPAKTQAGKPAPKPAAKKAPAKKTGERPATLRWTFPNGKDEFKDGKTQIAPFANGELAIERADEKWRAIYRVNGKVVETLAEPGSFGRAYNACTAFAKKGVAA